MKTKIVVANKANLCAVDHLSRRLPEYGEVPEAEGGADEEAVCFYAECSNPLTAPADKNWMTLYLKTGNSRNAAWEGYDFVLNRLAPVNGIATVEKCAAAGRYQWLPAGTAEIAASGNQLALRVDRKTLGLAPGAFRLEFKWSDNMQQADVMDFYVNGDAAPRGRMNYLFLFTPEVCAES